LLFQSIENEILNHSDTVWVGLQNKKSGKIINGEVNILNQIIPKQIKPK